MKSIKKTDCINSKAGLAIANLGGENKFPIFENLDEEKKYHDWSKKDILEYQKSELQSAPLTDKYFAVIGVRRLTIHDDYDWWYAAFTNEEDAKQYILDNKNNLDEPRIFNENAEQIEFDGIEDEEENDL